MKLQKIKKGTDDCVFDWILESDSHGAYDINNSAMIRVLVKKHNELIDYVEKLEKILSNERETDRKHEQTRKLCPLESNRDCPYMENDDIDCSDGCDYYKTK